MPFARPLLPSGYLLQQRGFLEKYRYGVNLSSLESGIKRPGREKKACLHFVKEVLSINCPSMTSRKWKSYKNALVSWYITLSLFTSFISSRHVVYLALSQGDSQREHITFYIIIPIRRKEAILSTGY